MDYVFSNRISSLQPSAIREILKFTADPAVIPFAAGNPAAQAFPTKEIAEITNRILSEDPGSALQYSVTEGYPALRVALKEMLKREYNIGESYDELIVTSGAQQAIELTCKALCNENDVVLCENPSFIGSLNSFRSYKSSLVGIGSDEEGIDLAELEKAMQQNQNVRFLYVIPNFQNPTGKTMSFARRKAVYELCKRYGVLILEDNPYGDLRFEGEEIPSIKSLDHEGRVVYCGSFSKIIAPGMRVGYVIADSKIISKLIVAKQCSDVHSNILAQLICHEFITKYDLKAHIARIREIYKQKCSLMLSEMDKNFGGKVAYTRPQGGLFVWCTLPEGSDMMGFCKEAVLRKVAVVPGNAFSPSETDVTTSFRMNYSTPSDQQIVAGTKILGELIAEMF